MKYSFQAFLLVYILVALANSNQTTNTARRCNINNHYTFSAGLNCKKIENVMSEVKQHLAELKQQIKDMKENKTEGPTGKANNCSYSFAKANYTKNIEKMFSEVKQQLVELKEEIRQIKGNQTGRPCIKAYKNCADVYKSGNKISGVYKIDPDGFGEFDVFCDHNETIGGGWTVFQRRRDGSVDFYRVWDQYKRGFGSLSGEFWLGLDKIHRLTASSSNKLRVDLERFNGETAFAEYSSFYVANETAKYKLTLGYYSGTAGDSLNHHRGSAFSTKDRDNDGYSWGQCAMSNKGGWWYNNCQHSNLNGLYLRGSHKGYGVRWYHWKYDNESLKRSEMKIRPKEF